MTASDPEVPEPCRSAFQSPLSLFELFTSQLESDGFVCGDHYRGEHPSCAEESGL